MFGWFRTRFSTTMAGIWIRRRLRERITPRTRAIALVHPNNPTGHYTKAAERAVLEEICAEHGLALIVDEVFLDYPLGGVGRSRAFVPASIRR